MRKQLIFLYIIIQSHFTHAIVYKHRYTVNEENDEVKVFWTSPCYELRKIINPYPKLRESCNLNVVEAAVYKCQKHFYDNWIDAVHELVKCRPRQKRGLTKLVKSTAISAATNFMKSIFTNEQNKDISHQIKNDYNINNDLDITIMRDSITNNIVNQHYINNKITKEEEDDIKPHLMPKEVYGNFKIYQAITTKSSLLKKITRSCRQSGTLDMEALSELIDDKELLSIPTKNTNIKFIDTKVTENWFLIRFDVKREIEFEENPDTPDSDHALILTAIILIILLTMALITLFVYIYYKLIRRIPSTIPSFEPTNAIELDER